MMPAWVLGSSPRATEGGRKRALFTPISAEPAACGQPFAAHHQTFKRAVTKRDDGLMEEVA
ncbi:hypothetical protein Rleg4DRAFT_1609 [Rhizobium leguminosarum bv. trifolii WSM2297]|uniref:Uncharacterized protein n=1 Tax=Rhizobium leguminosarum bv. trifolii WSM2297 TaxID=754762 RepID=J0CA87_RHILT|nr:hypothetical protein Rleg4DRAFT_1609 [Rhizobium leguminosarum bv. trifolii WSM2297]